MLPIQDLVIPGPLWQALTTHLLRPNESGREATDEQMAFVMASHNEGAGAVRLIAHDLLCAGPDDLAHQSAGGIGPTSSFVAAALSRCRSEGWSLIEVHSHPFDMSDHTSFSGIDWANDQLKMPALSRTVPYHATMVVGRRSLDAHYFNRGDGQIYPIREIVIVGPHFGRSDVARVTPTSARGALVGEAQARHDRQLPVVGAETQQRLEAATVAVVGLGGLGSFVALELAHLGAGHLVLIDPDTVEATNLNRLIGACERDIGRPKVAVFAEHIARLDASVRVTAVAEPIMGAHALAVAKMADALVGCVDNHGARLVLNQLALRYVIPLIDGGTGIRLGQTAAEHRLGGQVQYVVPGVGCLECRGLIDPRRAAFDLSTAEEQAYERAHGYGLEETAPSVIHLNGVVASLQVAEVLGLFGGQTVPWPLQHMLIYDGIGQRLYPATGVHEPDCVSCGIDGTIGVGDLAPIEPTTGSVMLRELPAELQSGTAV
ncbi:ThiF family adenylyltransferase [Nocardia elegans]|uniref:HesA/MoeB/ThiF family protein n=1 Tax=Nocardia elegans TaxID=300029 RepID=A0ABW6TN62_9NOCA|nr:ThiF family adenylyltransferase [Nocardia elegans]MBF6446608.1 ThiF family adenylyltransferase [Nocardia elegans]